MPKPSYPRSQDVPVGDLRPNAWNTNFVSPDNEPKLDASLREFGLFKEIVVRELDDGFEILGGQHRWESAVRVGFKLVPVRNLGPIDDVTAKRISLLDNARYGADDGLLLAELLQDVGSEFMQSIAPYTAHDVDFSNLNIALDDLDIDENFDKPEEPAEPAAASAPKTHAMMRFKVPLGDAERVTELITRTQKRHGLTESDAMTNAGDALVQLLFSIPSEEEAE